MMLSLAGMPALCNNFIDTHPHSILATRFLTEMLMNTAQQGASFYQHANAVVVVVRPHSHARLHAQKRR
jgi:hypothetical protein